MDAFVFDTVQQALQKKQQRRLRLTVNAETRIRQVIWAVWDHIIGPDTQFVWDVCLDIAEPDSGISATVCKQQSEKQMFYSSNVREEGPRNACDAAVVVHVCGKCGMHLRSCTCQSSSASSDFAEAIRYQGDARSDNPLSSPSSGDDSTIVEVSLAKSPENEKSEVEVDLGISSEANLARFRQPSDSSNSSSIGVLSNDLDKHCATSDFGSTEFGGRPTEPIECRKLSKNSSISTVDGADEDVGYSTHLQATTAGDGFLDDVRELSFSSSDFQETPVADSFMSEAAAGSFASFAGQRPTVAPAFVEAVVPEGSNREQTDEEYVAVHSLSSEMCRYRLESDMPTDFKLLSVPERNLLIASYIFSAKHRDSNSVQSLSIVMTVESLDWFLQYEGLCERWFDLCIHKIKARLVVEDFDEIASQATSEITEFVELLCSLDAFGLHTVKFSISDTFFASSKLGSDDFLRRCLSCCLQTKNHCIISGSDMKQVNRMLRTLQYFLSPEERCCSRYLVPNKDLSYCPFLHLQGIADKLVKFVQETGPLSDLPSCWIDMDKRQVYLSGSWKRHLAVHSMALEQNIERSLGIEPERPAKLEWKPFKLNETIVKLFLDRMDLLSQDCDILQGFLVQLMRFLTQKAIALLVYVEQASECGTEVKQFSVAKMRKALDLEKNGDFWAILAFADHLKPSIGQFVCKLMH